MSDTAETTIPTASAEAVVQLYDTVLAHVAKAAEAAKAGDFQGQFNSVMSATRIIDGLNRCLDMEAGGQVANSLRDMYESVSRALLRSVGKSGGGEACDRLISAVRETRDAWASICGLPTLGA